MKFIEFNKRACNNCIQKQDEVKRVCWECINMSNWYPKETN